MLNYYKSYVIHSFLDDMMILSLDTFDPISSLEILHRKQQQQVLELNYSPRGFCLFPFVVVN